MNGILQRLATASLIGTTLLGAATLHPEEALALTDEEIVQKLSSVPVFLIVDSEGRSLTANVNTDEEEFQVPVVFMHGPDAEAFLERAENQEAEFATGAEVATISLGSLYQEAETQLSENISPVYIPTSQAVQDASSLAEVEDFQGVPLFAAVNQENDQYLLYGDNTLPMFFSLSDLREQLAPYFEQNPGAQERIGVEVVTLEGLIRSMEAEDEELDSLLELIQFVPSSTTLQYLESTPQSSPQGGGNSQ